MVVGILFIIFKSFRVLVYLLGSCQHIIFVELAPNRYIGIKI